MRIGQDFSHIVFVEKFKKTLMKLPRINKKVFSRRTGTLVAILVIIISAVILILKNQIFADVQAFPECTSTNPYTVKAGKQIYMDREIEKPTNFPGVPQNYLVRISRDVVKRELGDFANTKTIVCYKKSGVLVQIPSFVESGEIWFQIQDDISQNSEAQYYISKTTDESKKLNLVNSTDIESHPFKSESSFSNPVPSTENTYWRKVLWNGSVSADFFPTNDVSPGGNDTLVTKNFKGQLDPATTGWSTFLNSKPIEYDPAINAAQKGTYLLTVGWAKFANVKVPRENNLAMKYGFDATVRNYAYKDGAWVGYNVLRVSDSVNTGWERYQTSIILRDDKMNVSVFSDTHNLLSGEISYSSFKFIKNIKAPRELKQTVSVAGKSTTVEWRENMVKYFGNTIITPRSTTNYPGSAFKLDKSTKLFVTNNFPDYYKDHFDGESLIVTKKLQSVIKQSHNFDISLSEIKGFSADRAIIVGDLENEQFRNFAYTLRPDIKNMIFQKEGFRIFVGEKYILAVGKDMVGSYYASLRLADLFLGQSTISQRMEEDYADNSFRNMPSWNITQREHVLQNVKDDISRISEQRYNFYTVNSTYEFLYIGEVYDKDGKNARRDMMVDIFSYARKYFMEPIASSFSFGYNFGLTPQNLTYKTRTVTVLESRSGQFALNLTRKFTDEDRAGENPTDIPLIVKNLSDTTTYKEGSDYSIEYKQKSTTDTSKAYFINLLPSSFIQPNLFDLTVVLKDGQQKNIQFLHSGTTAPSLSEKLTSEPVELWNKNKTVQYGRIAGKTTGGYNIDGSEKSWKISIPFASDIKPVSYKLHMTYNGEEAGFNKSNRLTSKYARGIATTGIDNAIKYLKPKYIHINNDEVTGVGTDYR
ncbi:MAG: hypothetical protein ABH810_01110, partial [bacterium]